jgi:mannitol/fructose-specific phosphotransferase system IIA component (Ntr-type)
MATATGDRFFISNLIVADAIQLRLRGQRREEVLTELIAMIPELAERAEARAKLLQALLEREQLHSTGIGDGVALPHARSALTGLVEKPVIVFGRHAQGVPYGAIDGQPAHLFFLLVTTSVTQHLHLLARISRLLRDPRLRQNLLTSDRSDRIIALIRDAEAAM